MNLQYFKPNKTNTGHGCSFQINEEMGVIFLSFIKQSSWDAAKSKGSFKDNVKNPNKTVSVKLNLIEIGGIIDAITNNRDFKVFHANEKGNVQISLSPYIKGENDNKVQAGFGLFVSRTLTGGEKTQFMIGFTFSEGELLKQYCEWVLRLIFLTKMNAEKTVYDIKGKSAPTTVPLAETVGEPAAESTKEIDDIF